MAIATDDTVRQYTEADYTDFEHTGPGTLAGRYLRLFWHPVYIGQELKPGWAVPVRLMNEDLTLYRGETGAVHLVDFRCAHRGTQLSTGWVEDDCIRCRYHGWKYDETGQCVEAPLELPGFPSRIRIKSYPVEEYLGLIFAYLGEGEAPPMPRYPLFEREGALEWARTPRACNYFNELENDPGHVAFTHRDPRLPRGEFRTSLSERVEETAWGIASYREYPTTTVVVHHGIPNIRSTAHARGAQALRYKVPIDDENLTSFEVEYLPPEVATRRRNGHGGNRPPGGDNEARAELVGQILAGQVRLLDVDLETPEGISLFNVQDDVTQTGQGVFRDRRTEHLGRSDAYVVLIRGIFQREMRALAEGRPLKKWELTADIVNTERPGAGD